MRRSHKITSTRTHKQKKDGVVKTKFNNLPILNRTKYAQQSMWKSVFLISFDFFVLFCFVYNFVSLLLLRTQSTYYAKRTNKLHTSRWNFNRLHWFAECVFPFQFCWFVFSLVIWSHQFCTHTPKRRTLDVITIIRTHVGI